MYADDTQVFTSVLFDNIQTALDKFKEDINKLSDISEEYSAFVNSSVRDYRQI